MKYKCGVIRDLMPLCMDDSASEESKRAVCEHISECNACEKYYSELTCSLDLGQKPAPTSASEYTLIAGKLRKRAIKRRLAIGLPVLCVFLLLLNYSLGFRFTAKAAAECSGRLNASSQLLGNYDWGDNSFFFYGSSVNYDTIVAQRYWNGWKSDDLYYVWPSSQADKSGITVTSGIYYFHNEKGILLLPILSQDPEIMGITITVFGETKSAEINTGSLSILAFENDGSSLGEEAAGVAYDKSGKMLYELEYAEATGRWVWSPVAADRYFTGI